MRTGRKLAGERGELPTRAGDIARLDVYLLFETHQLPVAGARQEGVAGFAGEADHGVVGTQRVAEQAPRAQRGDPRKLASAFIALANAENPPLRLPLGSDTVGRIEAKNEFVARELAAWRDVATSTDFTA